METYCVSCKKYTANENLSVRKSKQNRLMLLSNCAICGKKKLTIIKNKELHCFNYLFKMNKIFKKLLLLTGDKFIYSACVSFTKHRQIIKKIWETGNLKHLYRNELDKSCFTYDAVYSERNDLAKRTISDKILKDRAHEITRNCGYDGYQTALTSIVF